MSNHDSGGKFVKGNTASVGHGRKGKLSALRQSALSAVSPDAVIDAMDKLFAYGMGEDGSPGEWRALVAWLEIGGVTGEGVANDVMDRLEKMLAEMEERAGEAASTG